jgi:hypothetical protein
MSKAEGKKIAVKFTLPPSSIPLYEEFEIDDVYTFPVGIASASSQYSSSYPASNAFKNDSTMWYTRNSGLQWIMIELSESKSIAGFKIQVGYDNPDKVNLYGSNDGLEFDLIAETYNPEPGTYEHSFSATQPYKIYKWEIETRRRDFIQIYRLSLRFAKVSHKSGNEEAFEIKGQEYLYTDGPDNNGELISKTYPIASVQDHPTEPNSIQLIMGDGFRNVQGDITISYDQALGNLSGEGGAISSFEKSFTPTDLIEGLTNTGGVYGHSENIQSNIDLAIGFNRVERINAFSTVENISGSVSISIDLIHIDDINP